MVFRLCFTTGLAFHSVILYTHPGLSADGLGKFLGRIHKLRREGDKVYGDLHLSALAFKSPTDGNLGDYILERAVEGGCRIPGRDFCQVSTDG